jgi:exo-beta-1,3-glucanase (GH17 family)
MNIRKLKMPLIFCMLHILLAVMIGSWVFKQNQGVALAEPTLENSKLQCVSYAPYYGKDQTPLIQTTVISKAQIDGDLEKLAKITNCIRTYSVSQGLDYVPEAAKKFGLKVYLGVWIGWVDKMNLAEIALAAKVANAHTDTVKALIVGNEVLLRGEQSEANMQRYIQLMRKETSALITYADVWEFWKKHRNMEKHVDFITVHILPYWEDNPVAIEHAVTHTTHVMNALKTVFSKPILIGETGWPSMGRQRFEASPSLVNEARYVREFLTAANENHWQYNVIEAIDQPWKRNLEGTVGGYWGIFATDFTAKFPFKGTVSNRHDGLKPFIFALIGAVLCIFLAQKKHETRKLIVLGVAALGASSGFIAMLQWDYLFTACRNIEEWLALGGLALAGWLAVFVQPWAVNQIALHQATRKDCQTLAKFCLMTLMITGFISSYLIFTDGRYRDFPILLFVLPAISLLIQRICGLSAIQHYAYLVLGIFSSVLAWMCLQLEPNNLNAMYWLILQGALVFASVPKKTA